MQTVDNRGLACPEPVIRTKRALDALERGAVLSVVDNLVAKENVLRLAQGLGLPAEVTEEAGLYRIMITKGETVDAISAAGSETDGRARTTLLVQTDVMGTGDERLGQVLMKSFFYALAESGDLPREVYFLNSGVRLTCQGSPILDRLERLQAAGVQIWSCGTCLDFYDLKGSLAIGDITNMYSIVEAMQQADKTITLG